MKRKHVYTVDGDILNRHNASYGPRYMDESEEKIVGHDLLLASHFACLPIEVTCLILGIVAQKNVRDFQAFLHYLLPLYNVPLSMHQARYDTNQKTLLSFAFHELTSKEGLFEACFDERVGRLKNTTDYHTSPFEKWSSLKALVNAPYMELFTFVNCRLCEHCQTDLATTRLFDKTYWKGVEYDDDLVPLCKYCGEKMLFRQRVKKSTEKLDFAKLHRRPHKAYRWMGEKTLIKWCGQEATQILAIRKKDNLNHRSSRTLYLLKDALPFIKESCIINYKQGQSITLSDAESSYDEYF